MPALRSLQPNFRGFPESKNHLESLLARLRGIIEKIRSDKMQPFYTQRDLARFYRVPPRTVTLACQRLQAEGLLNCVRSSATYLTPRKRQPRHPVRGVVGLAIWEKGFADLAHHREFFRELERALRRYNYVADFVFYDDQVGATDFAEHLREHNLDDLVWFAPLPHFFEVIRVLADGGVRPFILGDSHQLAPFQQYRLTPVAAYVQALAAWRKKGIREIIWTSDTRSELCQELQRLLGPLKFRWRSFPVESENMVHYLSGLPSSPEEGIIIPSDLVSTIICRFSESALLALFRRARVLVTESLPLVQPPLDNTCVDVIRTDWLRLARRIASDIASDTHHPPEKPLLFQSRWLPRQSMTQMINRKTNF